MFPANEMALIKHQSWQLLKILPRLLSRMQAAVLPAWSIPSSCFTFRKESLQVHAICLSDCRQVNHHKPQVPQLPCITVRPVWVELAYILWSRGFTLSTSFIHWFIFDLRWCSLGGLNVVYAGGLKVYVVITL